ncbi:MAG TPA: transcriptional regulator NrdR [Candidatus Saccharimonadales bacterium]|jgi:transcriptional repressor NrdR
MKCNECQHEGTKVIESRDVADGEAVRRRRMCVQCGHRFTTYERIERPQLVVIKNNGVRQLYNRQKLLAGLLRASEKTSVTNVQLERLVTEVERELYACGEAEVRSAKVGELVMERLAVLNEVAYVRFVSVYRRFKDIAGFERELSRIKQRKTAELVKD